MKKLKDFTTDLNVSDLMNSKQLSEINGGYVQIKLDCHDVAGINISCPGSTCTGSMCTGGACSGGLCTGGVF